MTPRAWLRISIKLKARETVVKNFKKTAAAVFPYVAILVAFSLLGARAAEVLAPDDETMQYLITGAASILSFLVLSPMAAGIYEFCMKLFDGKEASGADVFLWMGDIKKLWRSMATGLLILIVGMFWAVVFTGVPVAVMSFFGESIPELVLLLLDIVMIVGTFFAARKINVCQSALIMLASDPDTSPIECMRRSGKLLKPYKTDYFVLTLSFALWILIAGFSFGILYIFVYPYMFLSQILFCRYCASLDGKEMQIIEDSPLVHDIRKDIEDQRRGE